MLRNTLLKIIEANGKNNRSEGLRNVQSIVRGVGKLIGTGLKKEFASEHKKQLIGTLLNAQKRSLEDVQSMESLLPKEGLSLESPNSTNPNEWKSDLNILENNISHKQKDDSKVLTEYKVPESSFTRSLMMGRTALSMALDLGFSKLKTPFSQGSKPHKTYS